MTSNSSTILTRLDMLLSEAGYPGVELWIDGEKPDGSPWVYWRCDGVPHEAVHRALDIVLDELR